MFHPKANIEKLTAEVWIDICRRLPLESIVQLSLTCKALGHLMKDELLFRHLTERDFSETERPDEFDSWLGYYQALRGGKSSMNGALDGCHHLVSSDIVCDIKRTLFKSEFVDQCDFCHSQPARYLSMQMDQHTAGCLDCLKEKKEEGVQLELKTGDLYCFQCSPSPYKLTKEKEGQVVEEILTAMKAEETSEDVDKRRKAEQHLYIQELRREDMSLKHYLVEKQWGRTWMLFRTREGSPLPGRITNNKLARTNGTLDPNIRLPMDKYRPSPETHGDIVSERLWSYLAKAYGVQGKTYSEDDIVAPEYARLRVYVDDFKKSIYLYP